MTAEISRSAARRSVGAASSRTLSGAALVSFVAAMIVTLLARLLLQWLPIGFSAIHTIPAGFYLISGAGFFWVVLVVFAIDRLAWRWLPLLAGVLVAGAIALVVSAANGDSIGIPIAASFAVQTLAASLAIHMLLSAIALIWAGRVMAARTRSRPGVLVFTAVMLLTIPALVEIPIRQIIIGGDLALAETMPPILAGWFLTIFLPTVAILFLLGVYLPAVLRRRRRLREAGITRERIAALMGAAARANLAAGEPDPPEVRVPPLLEYPVSPERYAALARAKVRYFWIYRCLLPLSILLIPLAIYSLKAFGFATLLWLVLLALLVGVRFRERGLRILLLRPFGEARMTAALQNFVCATIGRTGYVYTLSDRNYQPDILVALLVNLPVDCVAFFAVYVLGPLVRNSWRVATVTGARRFLRLERFLLRQGYPSLWSFLGGGQAFNIRSSDAWWRRCIQMLMASCEIIVVDLSKVKAGTEWELARLRERGLFGRCIFVVGEAQAGEVEAVLALHVGEMPLPEVFRYRRDGALLAEDAAAFNVRLSELTVAGLAAWGRDRAMAPPRRLGSE